MLAFAMRVNNQALVGLATVLCLIAQGYIFTYMLRVEPHPLISFLPLLPYVAYIYARGRRAWYFDRPAYWIASVVLLTALDIAPFLISRP